VAAATLRRRLGELNGSDGMEAPAGNISLEAFCQARGIRHINFLRIDREIDGTSLLEGARTLLSHARIDVIQFAHGGPFTLALRQLKSIFSPLVGWGYKLFWVDGQQLREAPQWHSDFEEKEAATYVAVHSRLAGFLGLGSMALLDLPSLLLKGGTGTRGVIHVGAHLGEEVEAYREAGVYRMILIEANPNVFEHLRARFGHESGIIILNAAVADVDENRSFHITNVTQSSSLLPLGEHAEIYPQVSEETVIDVTCRRLDGLLEECGVNRSSYDILNIHVQGAELMVLQGAEETLRGIRFINVGVNFAELYAGCSQIEDIDDFLIRRGFQRIALACPYHPTWGDAIYLNTATIDGKEQGETLTRQHLDTGPSAMQVAGQPIGPNNSRQRDIPRRNQLCPCGSGKKYKLCHGEHPT
jgi:FkbM family methyltransferase